MNSIEDMTNRQVAAALKREFGIKVEWVECSSWNTDYAQWTVTFSDGTVRNQNTLHTHGPFDGKRACEVEATQLAREWYLTQLRSSFLSRTGQHREDFE